MEAQHYSASNSVMRSKYATVQFLSGTATYVYIVCEWLHGTFSIEVLDGEGEGAEEEERRRGQERRSRGGTEGKGERRFGGEGGVTEEEEEEEEGQRGQGRR